MNKNIIDVFAVYGDACNVGGGILIGIFEKENEALAAAVGRGNIDTGWGNGNVVKKKAIKIDDEVYLLELDHSVKINHVLKERFDTPIEQYSFGIIVTDIKSAINFMKVVRKRTGMTLMEVKNICDDYIANGKAKIEPFHNSIDSTVTKETFLEWKQEMELNNYAKIEAI